MTAGDFLFPLVNELTYAETTLYTSRSGDCKKSLQRAYVYFQSFWEKRRRRAQPVYGVACPSTGMPNIIDRCLLIAFDKLPPQVRLAAPSFFQVILFLPEGPTQALSGRAVGVRGLAQLADLPAE